MPTAVGRLLRGGSLPPIVVTILAVAIAMTTVIFSITNAVLLRPLPFHDPDRLVTLWGRNDAQSAAVVELSLEDLEYWRARTATLDRIEIFGSITWHYRITAPGEPFSAAYSAVSGSFFETLGVQPMIGRALQPDDDRSGARTVVVLAADLWRRRFSSDPGIVGRTFTIGEGRWARSAEVVGVMPPEFNFPPGAQLWSAATRDLQDAGDRNGTPLPTIVRVFYGIGRLAPGRTIAAARAELSSVAREFEERSGAPAPAVSVTVTPLTEWFFGQARPALIAIAVAVLILLLIAILNAAGLLLVRGLARQREVGIRLALGATRRRIISQFVRESAWLVLFAALIGLLAARVLFDAVLAIVPGNVPRLEQAAIDLPAVIFVLLLCLVTSTAICVVPAFQVSNTGVGGTLGGRSYSVTPAPRAVRSRRVLIVLQLAAAVVLLIGAGLIGRSFLSLVRADLGFDARDVLTFDVYAPAAASPTAEKGGALVDAILETIEAMPETLAAGAISQRPFEHGAIGMDASVMLEGQSPGSGSAADNPILNWEAVTPNYFRTMDIALVRGRGFDGRDNERGVKVAIVSESTARRLWPGQDAIGKRLLVDAEGGWLTVVGLVEDARYREVQAPRLDLYLPHRQTGSNVEHFVLRASGRPGAVVPALRARLRELFPGLTVENARPMDQVVDRAMAPWWFSAVVFATLSAMALLFAAAGLFAVVSYAVTQRTREIGVRIAIGATVADIVSLVAREGTILAGLGLAIGLPASWALTRFLSSLLVDVTPTDAPTFLGVAVLLAGVCLAATAIPARRAAAIDPVIALRSDGELV